MRTSEIIMSTGFVASAWSAFSPESTVIVSKFWLFRNDSSRLRCGASSSTMRSVGRLPEAALEVTDSGSGCGEFDVRDAEDRAAWFVGEACDFPAMSKDDLLHHSKAESSPLLVGGKVRLENFLPMLGSDAGTIVANFDHRSTSVFAIPGNLDLTSAIGCLHRIQQQIEQALPQQLFVSLYRWKFFLHAQPQHFFLKIELQRAAHFADDFSEGNDRGPHFARTRIVDEFVQLDRDAIGFVDDFLGFFPNLRRSVVLFGNHLRKAADNV